VTGVGGSGWTTVPTPSGTRAKNIFGEAVFNTQAIGSLPVGYGAGATWGATILHELGHVMGLGHIGSAYQIMQPSSDNNAIAAIYGAGDLTGLRQLGRAAGCL
jgi:hypothetical protein